MTNQEILTKAIEKAIAGGWMTHLEDWNVHKGNSFAGLTMCIPNHANKTKIHFSQGSIIYRHDFAKALWGEGHIDMEHSSLDAGGTRMFERAPIGDWKSHLKAMVIAPDPIQYLGENLPA